MHGLTRGAWVRHRPTGRFGRVEIAGETLVSIAPYPPDNDGWLTARTGDFVPLASVDPRPGTDRAAAAFGRSR